MSLTDIYPYDTYGQKYQRGPNALNKYLIVVINCCATVIKKTIHFKLIIYYLYHIYLLLWVERAVFITIKIIVVIISSIIISWLYLIKQLLLFSLIKILAH